jgi:hypothetical protein
MNRRIYIISYELVNKWITNYNNLYNTIISYGEWMHYIDNTWFIVTDQTPIQIYNSLQPHLRNGCKVIITPMTDEYFGLLPQEAWNWINERSYLL